ncbi:MAG: DUF3352 domain-containing protein [Chitinophagales bacterium]
MNQKKYILGAILALVLAINIYILVSHHYKKQNTEAAFSAISQRTAMFLYSQNLDSLIYKVDSLSYKNKLNESSFLKPALQEIENVAYVLKALQKENQFTYKEIVFAANHIGSGNLGFLNIINFNDFVSNTKLKKYFENNNYIVKSYQFQDYKVFTVEGFKENKLSFAVYNNLLVWSSNGPLLEEALNAISTNKSKYQNALFTKLYKQLNTEADLHLYIDHSQNDLQKVINNKLSSQKHTETKKISDWSYTAINFEEKSLNFNTSFEYFNASETSLANILNSKHSIFTLDKFLPNNTAYFEAINSKNNTSFQSNEASYEFIKDWLAEEAAYFCLETFDEHYLKRSGLILKTSNIDTAKVNLYLLNKEMSPITTFEGHAIYEMNVNVISSLFKSNLFALTKPYFIFINKCVVFSDEINVLRTFIQKTKEKKFLATDLNYKITIDSLANKIVYLNPQKSQSALNNLYNKGFFPNDLGSIDLQFFNTKATIKAKGNIRFDAAKTNKTTKLWNVVLDSTTSFKPQLVINADNLRREIFTQDDNNTIYLINQSGETLLKKQFSKKILGDVYQIDLYKANKLYYVFNTKTHIYVMKRNGTVLDGYPIKLPAEATNAMLVVNYDKAKKYRFFVACANNKIYAYQADGKPLKGWSPLPGNYENIIDPISYTVFKDRDYIFFHNKAGTFNAFNRKGEKRFEPVNLNTPFNKAFEINKNGFVNFSKGSVYKVNTKGKTTAKILGDSTYTIFADYERKDAFAVASFNEFRVAKSKWTILGKRKLNDEILSIEKVVIKGKYWFLVEGKSSTYLINDLGEIHRDFPILSSTKARITNFYSSKNKILLIQEGNKLEAFELVIPD